VPEVLVSGEHAAIVAVRFDEAAIVVVVVVVAALVAVLVAVLGVI
jgi:hypothetical protein